jgi:hypothetical protein
MITPPPRHTGLRFFDLLLRIAGVLLAIVTLIGIPLFALSLTGRGSTALDAEVQPPYTIRFNTNPTNPVTSAARSETDRMIEVIAGARMTRINFPNLDDERFIREKPTIKAKVTIDRHDTDTRAVVVSAGAVMFGLSWLGLVNLRRIVRSARNDDPFNARNAVRLRWLAGVVIAAAVVSRAAATIINETLDAHLPVRIATPGPSIVVLLLIVVGLLALAEVFREGAELRALEQATI